MAKDLDTSTWEIIDMDSHWTEPPDLWTSRAPAKLKDLVPWIPPGQDVHSGSELVASGDKAVVTQWWVAGDVRFSSIGGTVIKADGTKVPGSLATYEEMEPAAYDIKARLKFLDHLGLKAQVIFPNIAGFGGTEFLKLKDDELRLACVTIYNDAIADMQREGQNRLFPQAIVPFWDIDLAVKEIRRAVEKLGLTGIVMCDRPEFFDLPYFNEPHWDPFWEICQELDIPVNFHLGAGGTETVSAQIARATWPTLPWAGGVASAAIFLDNMRIISNVIMSGILERFPRLRIVSVESGLGWIPFFLESLDYQFNQWVNDNVRKTLKMQPSDYFRRQVYCSFWFEEHGPKTAIDFVGVDNVMFETDFPHHTCLYPGPREHGVRVLKDLGETVARKVLHDNAVRVYRLPI